ncbi:Thoeris anti-defense Tad2 family protein [Bacillus sp. Fil]|uniref:Thoeris anti-defense Tad2 family protein n=1 Tax=Bacillus sp. Fil TaxID=3459567 RepID=UPI00403B301C
MNIQEVTKLAMEQNKFISRLHFIKTFRVKIKPANTYELRGDYSIFPNEFKPRKAWNPCADDWIIVD